MRTWPIAILAAAAVAALVAFPARAGTTPAIQAKQAQGARVLAEVNALDERLSVVSERYNGARYRLETLKLQLRTERRSLARARVEYRTAQARLDELLVNLYTSDRPSPLEVILGAETLADVLSFADARSRIGREDETIAAETERARERLHQEVRAHERDRAAAARAVRELESERATMERGLAERRALLATVQAQIAQLQAEERARQARLAALARARLAAEARARAHAQEQARAAARAREQAAARRAAATASKAREARVAATAARAPAAPAATTTQPVDPTPPPVTTPAPAPPAPVPPTIFAAPSPVHAAGHPQAARLALQELGSPYLWGGSSPGGFDCSGLVSYVYAQLGVSLPHYAAAQWTLGVPVSEDELQPGDLVFFDNLNHVGISLGGNEFVDAPRTGTLVRIDSLDDPWYSSRYMGARRI